MSYPNIPNCVKRVAYTELVFTGLLFFIIICVYINAIFRKPTDLFGNMIVAIVSFYCTLMLLSAYRILKGSQGAAYFIMVVSFIRLFGFPLGTVWGIFNLYSLSRPDADNFFAVTNKKIAPK